MVGAGLMGAGIAHVTIDKGMPTVLKDVSGEALARGQNQIYKGLDGAVRRKKITTLVRNYKSQIFCYLH